MAMNTTLLLIILALLIIFGISLVLLGMLLFFQQRQIQRQNEQIKKLRFTPKPSESVDSRSSAVTNQTVDQPIYGPLPPPETKVVSESDAKKVNTTKQITGKVKAKARVFISPAETKVNDNAAKTASTTTDTVEPIAIQAPTSKTDDMPLGKVTRHIEKIPEVTVQPPQIPVRDNDLEITEEFAFGLELMSGNSPCIFITGKAGTGKSRLLNYFHSTTKKTVALLAPTGMAALKISGQTLHSFFGFPPRMMTDEDIKISPKKELYQAVDAIIIDEVSMVRVDLMDRIDEFLRLNGPQQFKPFGGIQMIFFGDLYQLPPVVAQEEESQYIASHYDSPFFFDAHVFENLEMEKLELTRVFRQKDPEFVKSLNAIRTNTADMNVLHYINQRHMSVSSLDRNSFITLVTTNAAANEINQTELEKIPYQALTYFGTLEGEFTHKSWKDKLPVDVQLTLKVGAQVIFVKNDKEKRWLNGDKGRILELGKDYIRAEVNRDGNTLDYVVNQETWELIRYTFDYSTRKIKPEVIGKFIQYPLRLGWAITIHKSQGSTIERAHVDLGRGAFASGQAYVALSRCKSLEGLTLERPVMLSDIFSDGSVSKFMASAFPAVAQHVEQPVVTNKVENNAKQARFVSTKIDEEHKYTEPSHGSPNWYADQAVNMVLPILYENSHGVDLRKYRGQIKVFVDGGYRWTATISDEMSAQSLWKATQALSYVSVMPVSQFDAVRLSTLKNSQYPSENIH